MTRSFSGGPRVGLVAFLAVLSACIGSDGGAPDRPPARQAEPVVVGNNHRALLGNFVRTEVYHRADVAHVDYDVFAIGAVNNQEDLASETLGDGWLFLYDWEADEFVEYNLLGHGIRTVRVAEGCRSSQMRWTRVAWEAEDGVHVNRVNSGNVWGTETVISGARFPTVTRGTDNYGNDRVVLNYELTTGERSYLYYRFLYCNGTVGTGYAMRSVGAPWFIWHIEAAYNTHLDRWRIFWDEYISYGQDATYADMRTKWLVWSGVHSNSTFVCHCCCGGPACTPACGRGEESEDVVELRPGECEDYDYPPDYGVSSGSGMRASTEGCKGLLVSFDPSIYNALRRFLVSGYHGFWFVSEDGEVCEVAGPPPDGVDFATPVTDVSNVGEFPYVCSYQEIGRCRTSGTNRVLSHRRFTEGFAFCNGGDNVECDDSNFEESPITPLGPLSYPVAMGVNDDVAVVVYLEDTGASGDGRGTLYISVINN